MSEWDRLPRVYRQIAEEVCTAAELEALAYHVAGWSERRISKACAISRRSVRDRLDSATRKIHSHPAMPQETEHA